MCVGVCVGMCRYAYVCVCVCACMCVRVKVCDSFSMRDDKCVVLTVCIDISVFVYVTSAHHIQLLHGGNIQIWSSYSW